MYLTLHCTIMSGEDPQNLVKSINSESVILPLSNLDDDYQVEVNIDPGFHLAVSAHEMTDIQHKLGKI